MDIKVSLVLTERGRKHTSLGFERIEVLDFGYAQDGTLETILCIGGYSTCPHNVKAETSHVKNPNDPNSPICDGGPTGSFGIFPIVGADIFEDLFMHYNVEKEGE